MNVSIKLTGEDAFLLLSNIILSKATTRLSDILWKNLLETIKEFLFFYDSSGWSEFYDHHIIREFKGSDNTIKERQRMLFLYDNSSYKIITLYSISYLKYLWDNIESGALKPNVVLRLNGIQPLVYLMNNLPPVYNLLETILEQVQNVEKLTTNQQILYFTFLEICRGRLSWFDRQAESYQLLTNFYNTHTSVIQKLRNIVSRQFPHSKEDIIKVFSD